MVTRVSVRELEMDIYRSIFSKMVNTMYLFLDPFVRNRKPIVITSCSKVSNLIDNRTVRSVPLTPPYYATMRCDAAMPHSYRLGSYVRAPM